MADHPYREFESTELWSKINEVVTHLEANSDVKLTTARHLVIGSIVKAVAESGQGSSADDQATLARIEAARRAGAVFVVKWDGERTDRTHTVIASLNAAGFAARRDSDDLPLAIREVLEELEAFTRNRA